MLCFKKSLLGSSALLAAVFFFSSAPAGAVDFTAGEVGAAAQWGSSATEGGTSVADAAANMAVTFTGNNTLLVKSDGIASDTDTVFTTFTIGAVGDGANTGNITFDATTGNNTSTIASVDVGGVVTVQNSAAGAADVSVTSTGNFLVAGAVTVTGGGVSGNDTTLTLGGTLTSVGSLTLDDATGSSYLVFNRAGAQSITGAIDGAADGEGTLTLSGSGTKGLSSAASHIGATHNLKLLAITGDVTLDASGSNNTISATNITLNDTTSTVTLGTGALTGAVDGTSASKGTLIFAGNNALAGNVGSTYALYNVLVVDSTVSNGAYALKATSVTLDGAAVLNIGAGEFSGTLDGYNGTEGTVNFTAGTHTTSGNYGATQTLTAVNLTGGTLNLAHNITATTVGLSAGDFTLAASKNVNTTNLNLSGTGTVNLGLYTLTDSTGSFTNTGTTSNITMTINNTAAGGLVLTAGNFTNAVGNTLTITPTLTGTVIKNGDMVKFATLTAGTATLTGTETVVETSGLITWTLQARGATAATDRYGTAIANANDLVLVASVASASSVTGVAVKNAAGIDALSALATTADANLSALAATVQTWTTASGAQMNTLGAQLRPDTNGALREASLGATNQVLGVIGTRTGNIRLAQAGISGVASGESTLGLGVWAQGFGTDVDQDRHNSIDGYEANTYGVAVGVDYRLMKNLIGGASFAYANTNVDDKGARTGSGEDVNSYVGALYGSYTGAPWYVDGMLAFGYHDYDTIRYVTALAETAKGNFGAFQWGVKAEAGYDYNWDFVDATVTPFASLAYNHLDMDGYTETGATTNLTVRSTDTYSLKSGLGAKIAASYDVDGWGFKPSARAAWAHEFNSDAPDITATYAATGGTTFTAQGIDLAQDAALLGVGFDLLNNVGTTLTVKYDAELKEDYVGHAGLLQIRQEF